MLTTEMIPKNHLIKNWNEKNRRSMRIFSKNCHRCPIARSSKAFANSIFIIRIPKSSRNPTSSQSSPYISLIKVDTLNFFHRGNQRLIMMKIMSVKWRRIRHYWWTKCLRGNLKMKSMWHHSWKISPRSVTTQSSTPTLGCSKADQVSHHYQLVNILCSSKRVSRWRCNLFMVQMLSSLWAWWRRRLKLEKTIGGKAKA